eukprot:Pgem_evm1s1397
MSSVQTTETESNSNASCEIDSIIGYDGAIAEEKKKQEKPIDIQKKGKKNKNIAPQLNKYKETAILVYDKDHFKPDGQTKYFLPYTNKHKSPKNHVTIVIPFYNESKEDLLRTLESLFQQEYECLMAAEENEKHEMGLVFHYVAVMDGYYKASDSMKEYFNELYGEEWQQYMDGDEDLTMVLQKKSRKTGGVDMVEISPGKFMRLSLVAKKSNRKKTNSHEWFFKGFAPEYNGEYAFATDCGTIYGRHCLFEMIYYLHENRDVAAVTGRQRVMSRKKQNLEPESLEEMWYRAAQAFDYESSISSFQGAFSICGMLPVLPGPCGMYRMSDIQGEGGAIEYYMNFINTTSPDDGIFPGNLLLAEDRVLSFAAALKTGKYTKWVPGAIFYCEAETDIETFIVQRRRWINGTFAGRLIGYEEECQYASYGVGGFCAILYSTFVLVHYKIKFVKPLFNLLSLFNTLMFLFSVAMVIISVFTTNNVLTLALLLLVVLCPFFLAVIHDIDVFLRMCKNFIPFYLLLPTFVPYFMAYAFSRTWDLSWGNRPSETDGASEQRKKNEKKLKQYSLGFLILVMVMNFSLCSGLVFFLDLQTILYVSCGIMGISLCQQLMSAVFFLFYTNHQMTTGFDTFQKSTMKLISVIIVAIPLLLIVAALFTSYWLTTSFQGETTDFLDVSYVVLEKMGFS